MSVLLAAIKRFQAFSILRSLYLLFERIPKLVLSGSSVDNKTHQLKQGDLKNA